MTEFDTGNSGNKPGARDAWLPLQPVNPQSVNYDQVYPYSLENTVELTVTAPDQTDRLEGVMARMEQLSRPGLFTNVNGKVVMDSEQKKFKSLTFSPAPVDLASVELINAMNGEGALNPSEEMALRYLQDHLPHIQFDLHTASQTLTGPGGDIFKLWIDPETKGIKTSPDRSTLIPESLEELAAAKKLIPEGHNYFEQRVGGYMIRATNPVIEIRPGTGGIHVTMTYAATPDVNVKGSMFRFNILTFFPFKIEELQGDLERKFPKFLNRTGISQHDSFRTILNAMTVDITNEDDDTPIGPDDILTY